MLVQVSTSPIDAGRAEDLADVFRLLGDPGRVQILYLLLDGGEQCVGDIAAALDAPDTRVSQALRLLRSAGIVRNRRDGRHIHYRLDDEHVESLLATCRTHLDHQGSN